MAYYYKIYGLLVESDSRFIGCQKRKCAKSCPDVRLTISTANTISQPCGDWHPIGTRELPNGTCSGLYGSAEGYIIYFPQVTFHIDPTGTMVRCTKRSDCLIALVQTVFCGVVASLLLYKRSVLPIHATAVCLGDSAIAIAGASGAGKSTLGLLLVTLGGRLITDDITAITWRQTQPIAVAGGSGIKIWPSAVRDVIGNCLYMRRLESTSDKRLSSISHWPNAWERHDRRLDRVYIISREERMARQTWDVDVINTSRAALELLKTSFAPWMLGKEMQVELLAGLSALVNNTECMKIRMSNRMSVDAIRELAVRVMT